MVPDSGDAPAGRSDAPMVCRIRIKGRLDPGWGDWFGGLVVRTDENGDTVVSGPVPDQATLHGLLKKVRDMGMTLLSIRCGEPDARG